MPLRQRLMRAHRWIALFCAIYCCLSSARRGGTAPPRPESQTHEHDRAGFPL